MTRSILLAALAVAAPAVDAQSFEGLGLLPDDSRALITAASDDGSLVAGYVEGPEVSDPNQAVVWTPTAGLRPLATILAEDYGTDVSAADLRELVAVSEDGSVLIGNGLLDGAPQGFRWSATEGLVGLGDLGGQGSLARGASADGTVIVGNSPIDGVPRPFRWTADLGLSALESLGGLQGGARATSDDGSVLVGEAADAGGVLRPVRWDADGVPSRLGSLGGDGRGIATAVSADGRVVVGASATPDNVWEAFRWTEGQGMVGLGLLDGGRVRGRDSRALSTSADGSVVVGGVLNAGGNYEAFVWTASGGMQLLQPILEDDYGLDLDGWLLVQATSISKDGSIIVGYGFNPDGVYEGWRAEVDLVTAEEDAAARDGLSLRAAPNPAMGRTVLTLSLDRAGDATVALFDVLGREAASLHSGPLAAGSHPLPVSVADLPAGIYVVHAEADGRAVSRTLTVVR